MKIWFISDTHNQHEQLEVPSHVDMIVHCGDESNAANALVNETETRRFFDWYASLAAPWKVFVPGNHSTAVELGLVQEEHYPEVHFLIHEAQEFDGLQFFGSPFTPKFSEWAFMKPRPDLRAVWESMPNDVDVLITHGPPQGIFDSTLDRDTGKWINVGSRSLAWQVEQRIRPQVHAFGHIHDEQQVKNFGLQIRGQTQYINCSCCDWRGNLTNHGFVLDVVRDRAK